MFEQLKNLGYTASDILKGFSKGDKVMQNVYHDVVKKKMRKVDQVLKA